MQSKYAQTFCEFALKRELLGAFEVDEEIIVS